MPFFKKKKNNTKNVDAFNSKSSYSGFVNDAVKAPIRIPNIIKRMNEKKKRLKETQKEAGGY